MGQKCYTIIVRRGYHLNTTEEDIIMKATFGMICNYNDIRTIETKGKAITWTEERTDRDGWPMTIKVEGYEYEGKRYTIGMDKDGWPIAWEQA